MEKRGFPSDRSYRLPQDLRFYVAVSELSARASLPARQGQAAAAAQPIADVIDMPYSGNKLHPTQKAVQALAPLVRSFTLKGELILDPFVGSGSTCATAALCGRQYLGIELDPVYFEQASRRMKRIRERIGQ